MAVTTLAASAATMLTNPGGADGNGNYSFQEFAVNDADSLQGATAIDGWLYTGDALQGSFNLDSVTFTKGNRDTALTVFLGVYDGATLKGISTNSFDWSATSGTGEVAQGARATFDFTGVTGVDGLSDAATYQYRFVTDGSLGSAATAVRLQVRNGNPLDGDLSGNAGTHDARMSVGITVIPEPSSTALLGLGGVALILRRRR